MAGEGQAAGGQRRTSRRCGRRPGDTRLDEAGRGLAESRFRTPASLQKSEDGNVRCVLLSSPRRAPVTPRKPSPLRRGRQGQTAVPRGSPAGAGGPRQSSQVFCTHICLCIWTPFAQGRGSPRTRATRICRDLSPNEVTVRDIGDQNPSTIQPITSTKRCKVCFFFCRDFSVYDLKPTA